MMQKSVRQVSLKFETEKIYMQRKSPPTLASGLLIGESLFGAFLSDV
jgi:hypothetical protein